MNSEENFLKGTHDVISKMYADVSYTRLIALYDWSKSIYAAIAACSGKPERQAIHASLVTADLLMRVRTFELDPEFGTEPHTIDSGLVQLDRFYPKFFYKHNKTLEELTLDYVIYDSETKRQVPNKIDVAPLTIKVTKPEEGAEGNLST